MKIYNEDKTEIIENPDLSLGYLKNDVLITHIDAVEEVKEEGHYETIKEYENGGKDVEWIVDKPGIEAVEEHDETENIQIYILYTEQELLINNANKLIYENKQYLQQTDYAITKMSEKQMLGIDISEELNEYNEIINKREEARRIINEQELIIDQNNGGEIQNGF